MDIFLLLLVPAAGLAFVGFLVNRLRNRGLSRSHGDGSGFATGLGSNDSGSSGEHIEPPTGSGFHGGESASSSNGGGGDAGGGDSGGGGGD